MRRLASPVFLVVTLALLVSPAAPAAGPLRHNADGTISDLGTGLTWVRDRNFAVSSGFARAAVLPRAQAVQLIAAMNAGAVENFGRSTWRLPTRRELLRISALLGGSPLRPHRGSRFGLPNPAGDAVYAWPVVGASVLSGFDEVAVLATNSIDIGRASSVQGGVAVNEASPGPTLRPGFELGIGRGTTIAGDIAADSIVLDRGAAVGAVSYNTLSNDNASTGPLDTPLPLPVFTLLPQFQTAALRPESVDVFVATGQTVNLPAGDYDDIQIASGGTLALGGGTYNVRSLVISGGQGSCGQPCRVVTFADNLDLRIAERLDLGSFGSFGPTAASGLTASQAIVYVGGVDGPDGLPRAVSFGRGSTLDANVYAPNGTIVLEQDTTANGTLIGRDVLLDRNVAVTLQSFFANHAPVADPKDVATSGATPLVITLSGHDVDGDDIAFAILTGPTQGTLGAITQDPPPTPTPRPATSGLRAVTAAVTTTETASVTYTPATAGNVADSFTYKVTDPHGAIGVATVRINPADTPEVPDVPPTTVIAFDGVEQTTTDHAVTITLDGDAPAGVSLSFAIVGGSGPANGTLGAVVAGSESPQRTASVVYTPNTGFNGTNGFDFTACGTISGSPVCDTAHVTITVAPAVVEPTDLAPDKAAETSEDRAVEITLGSLSSASGETSAVMAPSRMVFVGQPAAFLDSSEIAGNVADANNDGFGDEHAALPGSAPIFSSASVGFTGGGPGTNGKARFHIEWDISTLGTENLVTATVVLNTHRGTIDSLDTVFFAGAGGNSALDDSDFESGLEAVGATMPVPPLSSMPIGSDGTFSFDVRAELQSAKAAGATHFTVQGRVNESLAGPARGLEIRTSAAGNVADFLQPHLELTTPGAFPPTIFRITSLPANGILKDSLGATITSVPTTLPSSRVSYTPNTGFVGTNSFVYEVEMSATVYSGVVSILVNAGNCAIDPTYCDDGRP